MVSQGTATAFLSSWSPAADGVGGQCMC